jgi:Flp pilus assembly protein CpaB
VRTRLLTITLAAVLALVGVVAILAYVRQANERAVNGLKAETVVVAKESIAAGTSLSQAQQAGLLTTEKVPESSLSNPALQSLTAAKETEVVSGTVAKGQVLLMNMLESASSSASPTTESIPIPSGYVAVTVQLCASEASANYLTAGSRVDVFAIIPSPSAPPGTVQQQCGVSHAGVPQGVANTIPELPNIEVLSVTEAQPSSSSASTGSSQAVTDPVSPQLSTGAVAVTLAVTQAQAPTLIEVTQLYLPYLALLPTTG